MITEEIKTIRSGKGELRKFGITMGIILALLGGLSYWRKNDYYLYFFILSLIFLFCGFVTPYLLKPIHKMWMTLAILMSWFTTKIVLSIFFYLCFTPLGIVMRLFGKDYLRLKFNKNTTDSYWIPKETTKLKKADYERQF